MGSKPTNKPESPCGICRSYGHFTHNHPEGYINPMYEYLGEIEGDGSGEALPPIEEFGPPRTWNPSGGAGASPASSSDAAGAE